MAATARDPEALNALLTEIVTALLDHAQGEFEDATGRPVPLSRLQKLKLDAAGRLADMGLRQLGRLGDPNKQVDKLATLTNRYLPGVVDIVGEDAVRARLGKLPDRVRNRDTVRLLEEAGAHELAGLLGRDLPPASAAPAKPTAAAAPAPPTAPASPAKVAAAPAAPTPPAKVAAAPAAPTPPAKATAAPTPGGALDTLALLKGQLALMEELHRQSGEAIPRLRQALEEASRRR